MLSFIHTELSCDLCYSHPAGFSTGPAAPAVMAVDARCMRAAAVATPGGQLWPAAPAAAAAAIGSIRYRRCCGRGGAGSVEEAQDLASNLLPTAARRAGAGRDVIRRGSVPRKDAGTHAHSVMASHACPSRDSSPSAQAAPARAARMQAGGAAGALTGPPRGP